MGVNISTSRPVDTARAESTARDANAWSMHQLVRTLPELFFSGGSVGEKKECKRSMVCIYWGSSRINIQLCAGDVFVCL